MYTMNTSYCTTCNKDKDINEFGIFRGKTNKTCKTCRDRRNRAYSGDSNSSYNKEKYADYYKKVKTEPWFLETRFRNRIKRKYGITLEFFNSMLNKQKNKCAICSIKLTVNKTVGGQNTDACVDHNHKTKKVRGILCRRCNVALHYLEDYKYINESLNYLRVKEVENKESLR